MAPRSYAKRLAALERRLQACRPFIRASVVVARRPCIRQRCRACLEGRKHESLLLTTSVQGKAKNRYLPKHLLAAARRRTKNYRKAKVIWEQMSELWIEELLSQKR